MTTTRVASIGITNNTIGLKAIVAVSGVVLFGFTIGHMLGNLQVYMGPAQLNGYAKALHENTLLLWGTRVVLTVAVIGHIAASLALVARNAAARPVGYAKFKPRASNYASRTMKFTGPLLAAFIVYHILHLTLGQVTPFVELDAYGNLVRGFQIPVVAISYIVAMGLLGFHLYHGSWSFMQSLGLEHPRYNLVKTLASGGLAALVVLGNVSIPIAIMAGFVR